MSLKALIRSNLIDLDMRFVGFRQFLPVKTCKKWPVFAIVLAIGFCRQNRNPD